MNEATPFNRPEPFLKHQDDTSIIFYLTSRIPEDWAIWIRSHGGSVATQPTDAQFVIFPKTELLPREEQQVDAFKKRCITSWTQWAMDPTYQIEPLIEDHELDFVLRMLGVDDIEDESVNLGEICKVLSRRFPHHPIRWFEAQLRGYRPDVLSTIHQEIHESSPAAVPRTAPLTKAESPMRYLPTPISSQQQSQSQLTEEYPPGGNNHSPRPLEDLFQTPRSNTPGAAHNMPSHVVTPSQNQPLELGSGEEEQREEGGSIPDSPEDDVMSDGPIMGALSPISEQPRSPTPLELLFQGSGSPFGDDCDMDPLNRKFVGVPCVPPRLATDEAETAQLLDGIDEVSSWELTASIRSHSRSDNAPPTVANEFELCYKRSGSMERHEDSDDTLYKELDRVDASRVEEDEDKYGWELVRRHIRVCNWTSPAQLGRRINRLLRDHGGKRDWEKHLSKEANYKKVQAIRQKRKAVHWRALNPDADGDPPTHKWFRYSQSKDPAVARASPLALEVSDDELAELNPPRSRGKNRGRRTNTRTTAAGKKRKKATGSCTKNPNTHRNGVLAPFPSLSPSSSHLPGRKCKKEMSDSDESWQENVTQGRRKRRRFD